MIDQKERNARNYAKNKEITSAKNKVKRANRTEEQIEADAEYQRGAYELRKLKKGINK
jgi:hypothetical protein